MDFIRDFSDVLFEFQVFGDGTFRVENTAFGGIDSSDCVDWNAAVKSLADSLVFSEDRNRVGAALKLNALFDNKDENPSNRYTMLFRAVLDDVVRWLRLCIRRDADCAYVGIIGSQTETAELFKSDYADVFSAVYSRKYVALFEICRNLMEIYSLNYDDTGVYLKKYVDFSKENIDKKCAPIIHPDDREKTVEKLVGMINNIDFCDEPMIFEARRKNRDGEFRWCRYSAVRYNSGGEYIYMLSVKDVHEEKLRILGRLHDREQFNMSCMGIDPLTGIYNSLGFNEKAEELLKNNLEIGYSVAVIDIYRFSVINEMFGKEKGDELLKCSAECAKEYADKRGGIAGRISDGRFCLCVPSSKSYQVEGLIEEYRERLKVLLPDFEFMIYVGIYVAEDPTLIPAFMCDRAIIALESVEGNYERRYAYFSDQSRAAILYEQSVINDMGYALENGQFSVAYQPIYNISQKRFAGAEALIRWNHPKHGLLRPDRFLPVMEKTGFIARLDLYVFDNVCRSLADGISRGIDVIPISVNISAALINMGGLCKKLLDIAAKYSIPTSLLNIELTESVYAANEGFVKATAEDLQNNGFKVYMDDFGSGFSSFNMLKDIAIDVVKLDMSFMQGFEENPRVKTIITSVVRMARWLGIPVVAEGVETMDQADFLHSVGCEYLQGFYYSTPLSLGDYELLISGKKHDKLEPVSISFKDFDMDALMSADLRMELLWNSMFCGMGLYEFDGENIELINANHAYYEITGTDSERYNRLSGNVLDFIHIEDRVHLIKACKAARDGSEVSGCEVRCFDAKNKIRWLEFKLRCLGFSGDAAEISFVVNDITDFIQNKMELQAFRERMLLIDHASKNLYFDYNIIEDTMTYFQNDGMGNQKTVLIERYSLYLSISGEIHPDDRAGFIKKVYSLMMVAEEGEYEFRARFKTEDYRWYRAVYVSLTDKMNRVHRLVGRVDDIDKEKYYQHISEIDDITGIYNRRAFQKRAEEYISLAGRAADCAMLIIDVDDFKRVNDSYGHLFGDKVLETVGKMFRKICGAGEFAGRLGGDEFGVFIKDCGKTDPREFAEKIINRFKDETDRLKNRSISLSIGAARGSSSPEYTVLYKWADDALYQAKNSGKNRYVFFKNKRLGGVENE